MDGWMKKGEAAPDRGRTPARGSNVLPLVRSEKRNNTEKDRKKNKKTEKKKTKRTLLEES
jgi:hypothetical protein